MLQGDNIMGYEAKQFENDIKKLHITAGNENKETIKKFSQLFLDAVNKVVQHNGGKIPVKYQMPGVMYGKPILGHVLVKHIDKIKYQGYNGAVSFTVKLIVDPSDSVFSGAEVEWTNSYEVIQNAIDGKPKNPLRVNLDLILKGGKETSSILDINI